MALRVLPAVATTVALVASLSSGAAPAQELETRSQIIVNHVKPEAHEAYEAWVADYRAVVEDLIAGGKLSPAQTCAFRSWRVNGRDSASSATSISCNTSERVGKPFAFGLMARPRPYPHSPVPNSL